MEIKAYAEVTPPADWTSLATIQSGPPAIVVKLQENDKTVLDTSVVGANPATGYLVGDSTENCNDSGTVTNRCFDIHPGSAYAYGSSAADVQQAGVENVEIIRIADDGAEPHNVPMTTDICTEKWLLSPTAITCVEMQVHLKRRRNTGDTAHDIILDYSNSYTMHAMVGRVADKSDETLKFDNIAVDFTQFYTTTGATATTYSAAIVAAVMYSMAF